MPINLDAFRASVQNYAIGDNSFVRLSRSKEGQVTKYGNKFWETRRNYATDAEVASVREQFFGALQNEGVAGATLEKIRRQFGLDGNGKSCAPVAKDLSSREIHAVLNMADTYLASREAFARQLEKEGYRNADVKDFISNRLGLSDPAQAKLPVTQEEKEQFRSKLKKECQRLFDVRAKELGIPSADALVMLTGDLNLSNSIQKKIKSLREKGNFDSDSVVTLKADINEQIAKSRLNTWENTAAHRIAELTPKHGDCSAILASLMKKAQDAICHDARKYPTCLENFTELDARFDDLLTKFLNKATPMLDKLNTIQPSFGEEQTKAIRNMIFTETKFRNPKVLEIYSELREMMLPLMELSQKPKPSMDDFMKVFGGTQLSIDKLVETMKALDPEYGGDDIFVTYDQIFELGKATYKDKYHTDPQISADVKRLMERYQGQLEYLQNHLDDGDNPQNPLRYTRNDAEYVSFSQLEQLNAFSRYLNIGELNPAENITSLEKPVVDFLNDYGIQHRDIRNKSLDRPLGSNFQNFLLKKLNEKAVVPQNLKDAEPAKLLNLSVHDLVRTGCSWKLGGNYIARSYDVNGENLHENMMAFFEQDKLHGREAAAILGKLLNQAMPGIVDEVRRNSGVFFAEQLMMPLHSLEFEVNRNPDGSYDIRYTNLNQVQAILTKPNANAPQTLQPLDRTRSNCNYQFHLTLSFDANNKPSFSFAENPTLKGALYASPLTFEETNALENLTDPATGENLGQYALYDPEILNNPQLKKLLQTNDTTGLVALLKGKTVTERDANCLQAMGLNDALVKSLLQRMLPAENYLDKALMKRLLDRNSTVRKQAAAELKELCRPYIEKGWIDDFDITPDMALLLQDKELNQKNFNKPFSDFNLLKSAMAASNSEAVRKIPQAIAYGDYNEFQDAQAMMKEILQNARRNAGLNCLQAHDFSANTITLLASSPNKRTVDSLMEHIYAHDENWQDAIQALHTHLEALIAMRHNQ